VKVIRNALHVLIECIQILQVDAIIVVLIARYAMTRIVWNVIIPIIYCRMALVT
jgi:hypothetical protein